MTIEIKGIKIQVKPFSRKGRYRRVAMILFYSPQLKKQIIYNDVTLKGYKKRLIKIAKKINETDLSGVQVLSAVGQMFYMVDSLWDIIIKDKRALDNYQYLKDF